MTGERVERRLAAALAVDIAEYSRLIEADLAGTLVRLKAIRKTLIHPTLAAHRGRIVKTTGDAMLVEFAGALDAARGALDFQGGMVAQNQAMARDARLEFRIGLHVGEIIIDEDDIFGDCGEEEWAADGSSER